MISASWQLGWVSWAKRPLVVGAARTLFKMQMELVRAVQLGVIAPPMGAVAGVSALQKSNPAAVAVLNTPVPKPFRPLGSLTMAVVRSSSLGTTITRRSASIIAMI